MIDLNAIRARDAAMPEGYVLVPELVDRRALLAHVDALAAEVLALKEHCAALESREVCTVAHEDVETCGYCQRDALYRLLQGIVSDVENYADMSVRLKPGATAARMYFLEMP